MILNCPAGSSLGQESKGVKKMRSTSRGKLRFAIALCWNGNWMVVLAELWDICTPNNDLVKSRKTCWFGRRVGVGQVKKGGCGNFSSFLLIFMLFRVMKRQSQSSGYLQGNYYYLFLFFPCFWMFGYSYLENWMVVLAELWDICKAAKKK